METGTCNARRQGIRLRQPGLNTRRHATLEPLLVERDDAFAPDAQENLHCAHLSYALRQRLVRRTEWSHVACRNPHRLRNQQHAGTWDGIRYHATEQYPAE